MIMRLIISNNASLLPMLLISLISTFPTLLELLQEVHPAIHGPEDLTKYAPGDGSEELHKEFDTHRWFEAVRKLLVSHLCACVGGAVLVCLFVCLFVHVSLCVSV